MTRRLATEFGFRVPVVAGFFWFGIASALPLRGQLATGDWEKAAGGKMEFDVASVKQDAAPPSPQTMTTIFPLGPGNMYTPNGGLFRSTDYPLVSYVAFAYKMNTYQMTKLIPTLPKFVVSDRFDIEARANGNPTKDQMRLMVQSLLADRFKLAIHLETRQLPSFVLVLDKPGKTGPQLQPYPDGTPCDSPQATRTGAVSGPPQIIGGVFPVICGGYADMPSSVPGRVHVGARNVTIQIIADQFPGLLNTIDRPVYDRTGLTGTYDFSLEFSPEVPAGANFQPDQSGPTFLEALKDQLGLKLESRTGPVDVYVVDHIESLQRIKAVRFVGRNKTRNGTYGETRRGAIGAACDEVYAVEQVEEPWEN